MTPPIINKGWNGIYRSGSGCVGRGLSQMGLREKERQERNKMKKEWERKWRGGRGGRGKWDGGERKRGGDGVERGGNERGEGEGNG